MSNPTPSENPLVTHSRTELSLLGMDSATIESYIAVVQSFVDNDIQDTALDVTRLCALLQWQNLSELTDSPYEWRDMSSYYNGQPIWQNTRNAAALSQDGGKTYKIITESGTLYTSKVVTS